MSYNVLTIPQTMTSWCAGLDLGQCDNTQTGLIGSHQVHITVTKSNSYDKVGWQISMYQLGANG